MKGARALASGMLVLVVSCAIPAISVAQDAGTTTDATTTTTTAPEPTTLTEPPPPADAPTEGASAGDLSPITGSAVRDSSRGSVGVPAAAPSVDGSVCGVPGSAGTVGVVVVVVVVASVVVPASCATEIAGTAQLNARTSIPLARGLAPFIHRIVWGIDS
jgi:hypothetical protein